MTRVLLIVLIAMPFISVASLLSLPANLFGKTPVEKWDHSKLSQQADLVAIISPTRTVDGDGKMSLQTTGIKGNLQLVITSVTVEHVVKGRDVKKCDIHHYRLDTRDVILVNPPRLVSFRDKAVTITVKRRKVVLPPPKYLVYLKAMRKDSQYTFATDPMQSQDATFELVPPVLGD